MKLSVLWLIPAVDIDFITSLRDKLYSSSFEASIFHELGEHMEYEQIVTSGQHLVSLVLVYSHCQALKWIELVIWIELDYETWIWMEFELPEMQFEVHLGEYLCIFKYDFMSSCLGIKTLDDLMVLLIFLTSKVILSEPSGKTTKFDILVLTLSVLQ